MKDRYKFRIYDEKRQFMISEKCDRAKCEELYGFDEYYICMEYCIPTILNNFFDNYISINNNGNWDEESFVVMQCTGLKDKNGKLIYEGDIVEIVPEEENAQIIWDNDLARFQIDYLNDNVVADFDNFYSYELEVIGNIYENKELLNE